MRTIHPKEIAVFILFICVIGAAATSGVWLSFATLKWTGEFRGVLSSILFVVLFYGFSIVCYRIFVFAFPLPAGDIAEGSRDEAIYHVYLLFFLMLFYPLMKGNFVPVPVMRAVYIALGARLGANTYSGGILFDPIFVKIGSNTIIGQGALIIPHVIEGPRLAHFPIRIGSNVTIGANAIILTDVEIGDRAIVATGAVVTKGTRIAAGETWGGIPATRRSVSKVAAGTGA
jgi:acetyltransferase-like isoleucine patch superfamily enzyme